MYTDEKTCLWFTFLPGFVALLQTRKVVWELSNQSGMKVSTFSEAWESSCVKSFSSSMWLQLTLPQSFTISCSRCLPHNFLARLMSFSSRETRTSRSPTHKQRTRGIPGPPIQAGPPRALTAFCPTAARAHLATF